MQRLAYLTVIGWLGFLAVENVRAEVFVLTTGGRIEGELLNPDEKPRTTYLVKTSSGGMVTLGSKQVEKVVVKSEDLRLYEMYLPRMPDSVEGNLKMAQWCSRHGLDELRDFHLQQVILREPDHKEARRDLGYTKVGGRWFIEEEYQRSHGNVRYKGQWRLALEVEFLERQDKFKKGEAEWRKKLKMWRGWLNKKRHAEAVTNIRAVRDPMATTALMEMLEDETNPQVRNEFIEVLGTLPGSQPISVLANTALYDNHVTVRDKALEQLEKKEARLAVAIFIKALGHKENPIVNRAGLALGRMNDDSAVMPLIDALTTEHKKLVKGGGGGGLGQISPSFGSGGSGLSAGGNKPKILRQILPNEGVRSSLQAMTKENFQFNKAAWKSWYVTEHTPREVNLRRGG